VRTITRVRGLSALLLCLALLSPAVAAAEERSAKAGWREFALNCMDRMGAGNGRREYGLHFDKDIPLAAPAEELVVVVHGFHSDRWHVEQISKCIRDDGRPHAVFEYPNDQRVADSARLLSRELRRLNRSAPGCDVSLVTHSMGGLVAREAIENPKLDPANVTRLIMIAPPNHGSQLADCNCPLVDAWEYVVSSKRRKKAGLIYGAIEDGLGEAAHDLKPDSPFLTRLNARPRNANTQYSILLGNRAPLDSHRAGHAPSRSRCRWGLSWTASLWYDELDEVVNGRGDGVVSLTSGRLKGVEDIEVYPFDHIEVLGAPDGGSVDQVHAALLSRLGR